MKVVELSNISQVYKDKNGKDFHLFENLSLSIDDVPGKGQFVILMGESGCGKSTLLRYITGITSPTSGDVIINGKKVDKSTVVPMVFQNPSSLEWYTVLKNVALPLLLKGASEKEANEKAMEMINIVGLDGHEHKYAKSPLLSGGQLQRVAIARSLVANPSMIVMDEPFSALDSVNRRKMQDFLIDIFKRAENNGFNPTVLLVTHDEREAVFLGNDIFIMKSNPGRIATHMKVSFLSDRDNTLRTNQNFLTTVSLLESHLK